MSLVETNAEKRDGQRRKSITGKEPGEFRMGKTKRDRANNAKSTNNSNKQARADWQQNTKATNAGGSASECFPYGCCNGKRNRALKARMSKVKTKRR